MLLKHISVSFIHLFVESFINHSRTIILSTHHLARNVLVSHYEQTYVQSYVVFNNVLITYYRMFGCYLTLFLIFATCFEHSELTF